MRFQYGEEDRFPIDEDGVPAPAGQPTGPPDRRSAASERARDSDGRHTRGLCGDDSSRDRAAGRRGRARSRPDDRREEGHPARRHRDSLPHAREPPRVRERARTARSAVVRLQGPRLLRRRRDQGRPVAAVVPGRPVIESSRGRVAALPIRAHLGRGPAADGSIPGGGPALAAAASSPRTARCRTTPTR